MNIEKIRELALSDSLAFQNPRIRQDIALALIECAEALKSAVGAWGDYTPSHGNARKAMDAARAALRKLEEA